MKIWTLTAKQVRNLNSYTCYCDQNPIDLLYTEDYEDLLSELIMELYYSFHDDTEYPEDFDTWDIEEQEDWCEEDYNNWCSEITFEADEVEEPEKFEILIDERNQSK